jgi:hypothetical protein
LTSPAPSARAAPPQPGLAAIGTSPSFGDMLDANATGGNFLLDVLLGVRSANRLAAL